MKIGFLASKETFAVDMFSKLSAQRPQDEFIHWVTGEQPPATDLEVILSIGKVTSQQIQTQKMLALIQTASAGYESVDVDAATRLGIWVASAPTTRTGNGESVAEFAVLLMLAASRRLNEELAWTHAAAESRGESPEVNKALFGSTVCIVGLGGIGSLLVERLRGFGVKLTGVDLHPEHAPEGVTAFHLDELQQAVTSADYVVLAIPASKANENVINAELLAKMKKNAVLVNVGRGTLIDEDALLDAVNSGHLFAAGLDVVKDEPIKPTNPLLTQPRILVTPHIAGFTELMLEGTVEYLAEVLTRYQQGLQPEGVVNEPTQPRVPLHSDSPKSS